MCPALAAPAVGIDVAYCPCVATMSFLFVDQAGSTVQLEALGDAGASPIRDELFQILRAAVDDHEGTVVDHTGDGVMASFTGATDALGCRGRHPAGGTPALGEFAPRSTPFGSGSGSTPERRW